MPKKPAKPAELPRRAVRKAPATKKTPVAKIPAVKKKKPGKSGQRAAAELRKQIELIRKRNKILDLFDSGATIRQISELLESQGETGIKPTRVHELLTEALEDQVKNSRLKTKLVVQSELNKVQKKELALFGNLLRLADIDKEIIKKLAIAVKENDWLSVKTFLSGLNANAIEKYSQSLERGWKRRDSLLGLHKPIKVAVDARTSLAKLLGKSPEELPDGDSDA